MNMYLEPSLLGWMKFISIHCSCLLCLVSFGRFGLRGTSVPCALRVKLLLQVLIHSVVPVKGFSSHPLICCRQNVRFFHVQTVTKDNASDCSFCLTIDTVDLGQRRFAPPNLEDKRSFSYANGLRPSDGLQPTSDGLQPTSDALQPSGGGFSQAHRASTFGSTFNSM